MTDYWGSISWINFLNVAYAIQAMFAVFISNATNVNSYQLNHLGWNNIRKQSIKQSSKNKFEIYIGVWSATQEFSSHTNNVIVKPRQILFAESYCQSRQ